MTSTRINSFIFINSFFAELNKIQLFLYTNPFFLFFDETAILDSLLMTRTVRVEHRNI